MVALQGFKPVLTPFNTRELFDATMINFNLPGIQSIEGGLLQGHVQTAGGPLFRIAVFGDRPKYLDPAIPLEMHHGSLRWDEDFANRPVTAAVEIDFLVLLELGQPCQFTLRSSFRLARPEYQLSKTTGSGSKPRL